MLTLLFAMVLATLPAPAAFAQLGLFGGGQGGSYPGGWPRYRQYRDLAGQSYSDVTPTGRRGYFVSLGSPGFDDIGNGPSMAYSPIFNAPRPLPRPATAPQGQAPAAAGDSRPTGFLRRVFRRY
jgi:hypothetical protein